MNKKLKELKQWAIAEKNILEKQYAEKRKEIDFYTEIEMKAEYAMQFI